MQIGDGAQPLERVADVCRAAVSGMHGAARWEFAKLATLRQELQLRAEVLSNPGGELTLAMNGNRAAREEIEKYLSCLMAA